MCKRFQGAVGKCFVPVLPEELQVALCTGILCSPLLCGGSGSAVLFRAVLAAPSQHSLKMGSSRTWMHNRLVQALLRQWCVCSGGSPEWH